MRRENTFKIDYSQFSVKPSVEKLFGFCHSVLGLKREEIKRLQCHRGDACAFVKVSNLALAQKVVQENDGKHEVDCGEGKKHKLRITLEDGSVEVRVYDLPEDVPEEKVVEFLSAFGEVISIREVLWSENSEAEAIPLGIWSVRMLVKRNIDSWVTIDGEQAFVTFKGQLQSCRHCKEHAHTGISCVQNKKLLYQKSYANVAKQSGLNNRATTSQQPKKTAAMKLPNTKPVGQKSTAPSLTSLDTFPVLPSTTSQGKTSGSKAHTSSQPTTSDTSSAQIQRSQSPSPPLLAPPQAVVTLDDLFKKPVLRSQSKCGNGNDTDDSTTSTSSRHSRSRFPKKPRRDAIDDEKDVEMRA